MKKYCLLLAMLLGCSTTWAQGVFFLDETTHGSTLNVGTSTYIKCTGVDSMHSVGRGYDYWITVVGNCVGDTGVFHLVVDELDLRLNTMGGACADTLFVYDGVDTSADVICIQPPFQANIQAQPFQQIPAMINRNQACATETIRARVHCTTANANREIPVDD